MDLTLLAMLGVLTYRVILKYCPGFPWPIIFKPEAIKLLTEYESVTQKVLLFIETILQNAKQLQHERLSSYVRVENYRTRKPKQ
jgi:hypothetical protein